MVMGVRLKYQQGSFQREEVLESETDAISRATALALRGCLYFQLTDLEGGLIKNDRDIRKACASALRVA